MLALVCLVSGAVHGFNPIRSDGAIFVAGDGLTRYRADDLQADWRALRGVNVDAAVAVGETLLVSGSDGLFALDAQDGAERWRLTPGTRLFAPATRAGVAYVGAVDGLLRAVRIADGQMIWTRQFDGWVYSPAVFDHYLVVGGQAHELHALTRATGQRLWTRPTSQELVFKPVVADKQAAVITTFSGEIRALDAATGVTVWSVSQSVPSSSPLVVGEQLLFRTFDGALQARSALDGQLLWEGPARISAHRIRHFDQQLLALDESGRVIVMKAASGRALRRGSTPVRALGSPIISAGRVLVFEAGSGPHNTPLPAVVRWARAPHEESRK